MRKIIVTIAMALGLIALPTLALASPAGGPTELVKSVEFGGGAEVTWVQIPVSPFDAKKNDSAGDPIYTHKLECVIFSGYGDGYDSIAGNIDCNWQQYNS